ncbi:hypothetical protein H9L19_00190 [Weissella diestrammenae]|uniref:Uncharacterized protein n=1 Tax=Weissella diestrammenae TaxID=1162633 RepID=A0A7G9T5I8_9LACO|nr:hypothetical protein [Weissella diestrammenae]MCM0582187.1 hypothetical protein [Weissella diestrammenae]QNN75363.1 hypothetical protein H9L19_00190 [Weissella diestrammenae]
MGNKPKLFLDMDNMLVDTLPVLNRVVDRIADYGVKKPDQIPGIFKHLVPIEGAVQGVNQLSQVFEMYILSTAPWENPSAWTDKIDWLTEYFGNDEHSPFYKRVVMTHQKGVARANGGILIDDRPYHGAAEWDDMNSGTAWIQYAHDEKMTWQAEGQLVSLLLATAKIFEQEKMSEREALEKANASFQLDLHGPVDMFETSTWEDKPKLK